MSLPAVGDQAWGIPLNSYITNVVLAEANTAAANIASHQVASDPHGDRAYALSLVQPLTTGVNGPNGFLQLNSIGVIPTSVLPPGGGRTSTFDVVKDYSAPTNGSAASTAIQSALTAAGTLGGGEVWVGDGTYGIDQALYVPSNVWLHLSPGAVMQRIVGSGGSAPAYMVANFNGSSSGSGSGGIVIEGGTWLFDNVGSPGTPFAFVGGDDITVRGCAIRTLQQSPAILFAGCSEFLVDNAEFSTATPGSARTTYASAPPAVRIEVAASSVIPSLNGAIYSNAGCNSGLIRACVITGGTASDGSGLYSAFGGLAGTTAAVASVYHYNIMVADNVALALPYNAVYPVNWATMTVSGNQFNLNDGVTATASWNPSAPASTNQVVTANGYGDPSSSNTALAAWKTGNTSRSNTTTLTLDPDLQVTAAAGAVYAVTVSLDYTSSSSTEGILFDFAEPSGAQFNYSELEPINTGGGAGAYSNTAGFPDNANTGSGVSLSVVCVGLLRTGGSSGTFGLKWAQNSSSGTALTVFQGSFIQLTRLA